MIKIDDPDIHEREMFFSPLFFAEGGTSVHNVFIKSEPIKSIANNKLYEFFKTYLLETLQMPIRPFRSRTCKLKSGGGGGSISPSRLRGGAGKSI